MKEIIDSNIWNVFTSIGTVGTVIMALWGSGYFNQKRLYIKAIQREDYNIGGVEYLDDSNNPPFIISVTNTGKIPVTIKEIGYKTKKGTEILMCYQVLPHESRNQDQYTFPFHLKPYESLDIFLPFDVVLNDKENKKRKLYLEDSVCHRYYFNIKRSFPYKQSVLNGTLPMP